MVCSICGNAEESGSIKLFNAVDKNWPIGVACLKCTAKHGTDGCTSIIKIRKLKAARRVKVIGIQNSSGQ